MFEERICFLVSSHVSVKLSWFMNSFGFISLISSNQVSRIVLVQVASRDENGSRIAILFQLSGLIVLSKLRLFLG